MFHYAGFATEGAASDLTSVVYIVDLGIAIGNGAVGALHPRGHVERSHPGVGAISNGNLGVVGLAYQYMLTIVSSADGAVIGNLCAACHREGWGSDGDAFKLAQEVAGVRWLVVAHALPHHSLTILMVVPQRVVAIVGLDIRGIYAYIFIIGGTHDDFLAPVAQHIASGRWGVLRPVAVGSTISSEHHRAVSLEHTGCTLATAGSVESFLQQVAIPIDAEVIRKACRTARDDLVSNARDST